MSEFHKFQLPTALQARIKFTTPTPIQDQAIPLILKGADVIGVAQTGTGKTAAFSIPMLARMIQNPASHALIMAPTRELALQIADVIRSLTDMKMALLIGGVEMRKQFQMLKANPSIFVGTPGRINDHLRRRSLNLSRANIVVLDEADRMLDMGFEQQINEVLKHIPQNRQTLLFSATMPERVKRLTSRYQNQPQFVSVGRQAKPVEKIQHSIVHTTKQLKRDIILDELNARKGSVIIFVNTKHGTNRLHKHLEDYGYPVTRIHGGRTQGQRNQALNGFRDGKFRIMVATDVAARGLDVPHIQHVINFDLPKDVQDYVHRIGRTARAGNEGQAIALLSQEDRHHWNKIAKYCNLEMLPDNRSNQPKKTKHNQKPSHQKGYKAQAKASHGKPAHGKPSHGKPHNGNLHHDKRKSLPNPPRRHERA